MMLHGQSQASLTAPLLKELPVLQDHVELAEKETQPGGWSCSDSESS